MSLSASDIVSDPALASVGLPFLLLEVRDEATLDRCELNTIELGRLSTDDGSWIGVEVFTIRRTPTDDQSGAISVRMFAPEAGVPEDPATGSAAACLTAFLAEKRDIRGRFEITQGVKMGRPSRIDARTAVDDNGKLQTFISGCAVAFAQGELMV